MYRSSCSILFLTIVMTYVTMAQDNTLDSLKNLLQNASQYEEKIALNKKIGKQLKINDPKAALPYYQQIISIAKEKNDSYTLAGAYNGIGIVWYKLGDLQQSTKHYFMALEVLDDIPKNHGLIGLLNNNIGWNFQEQKDYKRAAEYYETSINYMLEDGHKPSLGLLLNNTGDVYKYLGKYDEALSLFKESLKINREIGNDKQQLFNIHNIGEIYVLKGKYQLAIDYFTQALKLNYQRNDLIAVANNLHNLGDALYKSDKSEIAKDTLLHALEITNALEISALKHKVLFKLYEVCNSNNNYKEALNYFTEYQVMDDSLYRKGQYTSLVELEAKYKVSQNERTIQLSQTQLLNQRLVNAVILAALFVAVLLIVFLIWVFLIKKKNEQKLIELNEEIDTQNAKIQAINQNLEITIEKRTQTIQAQNIRLKDFAFMNSHNIRRPLSNVLGIINLLKEEKESEKLKELIDMLDNSAQEMDGIILKINQKLQEENL